MTGELQAALDRYCDAIELLNLGEPTDNAVKQAQVHATLAVAGQLERLNEKLGDDDRPDWDRIGAVTGDEEAAALRELEPHLLAALGEGVNPDQLRYRAFCLDAREAGEVD